MNSCDECNCYHRAPTVPTYRDQFTHLQDCPCYGMLPVPVGMIISVARVPATVSAVSADAGK